MFRDQRGHPVFSPFYLNIGSLEVLRESNLAPEQRLEFLGEQPPVNLLGHVRREKVHPGAPIVEVLGFGVNAVVIGPLQGELWWSGTWVGLTMIFVIPLSARFCLGRWDLAELAA